MIGERGESTDPWDGDDAAGYERLDFRAERDHDTTSWSRARPRHPDAEIAQIDRYRWAVKLPDGGRHLTEIGHAESGFEGRCECQGFAFNPGPCAHLCALRKSHYIGDITIAPTNDALADDCPTCGRPYDRTEV